MPQNSLSSLYECWIYLTASFKGVILEGVGHELHLSGQFHAHHVIMLADHFKYYEAYQFSYHGQSCRIFYPVLPSPLVTITKMFRYDHNLPLRGQFGDTLVIHLVKSIYDLKYM